MGWGVAGWGVVDYNILEPEKVLGPDWAMLTWLLNPGSLVMRCPILSGHLSLLLSAAIILLRPFLSLRLDGSMKTQSQSRYGKSLYYVP